MANCTFYPYSVTNWTDVFLWYYNYDNHSTIWCDQDFNFKCNATFSGDSDIGGYGVMTSFIVIAGITTVLATISAYTPSITFKESFGSWWSAELPKQLTFEPDITKISDTRYWLHEFSTATLPALCDLQLITGAGIMIAGLVHIDTISMYHRYLVCSYWYLTFNSLWSATAFATPVQTQPRTAFGSRSKLISTLRWLLNRDHLQTLFIFATVAIAIYVVTVTTLREQRQWDPLSSGNCYRYDQTPFPISEWVWIGGLYAYEIGILLSLNSWTENWVSMIEIWLSTAERRLISTCWSLAEAFTGQNSTLSHLPSNFHATLPLHQRNPASISKIFLGCPLVATGVLTIWTARQILAILALTSGTQGVTSFFYVVFYAMNTASTIRPKILNRDLVQQETSWGFGQILPLILILSILLLAVDATVVADEKLGKKRSEEMKLNGISEGDHKDETSSQHKGIQPNPSKAYPPVSQPTVIYARPFFGLPLYRAAREAESMINMITLPESSQA